jgi:hypothetical protein
MVYFMKSLIHLIVLSLLLVQGALPAQTTRDRVKNASKFQVVTGEWYCLTSKNGLLIVVPPDAFPNGNRITIKVNSERLTAPNGVRRLSFTLITKSKGKYVQTRPGHPLYVEFPIEAWIYNGDPVIVGSDGSSEPLRAFPYSVEFPLDQLWFPTMCDGVDNWHGYSDTLSNARRQGTIISTREFQQRYHLLQCRTDILELCFPNLSMQLFDLDSVVASFSLSHMLEYMEIDEPTFVHDSLDYERFLFFMRLRQVGPYPSAHPKIEMAPPFDWKHAEDLIRKKILDLPEKKWLHERKFVPVLITTDKSYIFSNRWPVD